MPVSFNSVAATFLALATGCHWPGAEEFRARLQCELTPEEVGDIARSLGQELRPLEDKRRMALDASGFVLSFNEWGLLSYHQTRSCGFMCAEFSVEVLLCDDAQALLIPILQIRGPYNLNGAEVRLDGREVGTLKDGGEGTIHLESLLYGRHTIELFIENRRVYSDSFEIDRGYWPDRIVMLEVDEARLEHPEPPLNLQP